MRHNRNRMNPDAAGLDPTDSNPANLEGRLLAFFDILGFSHRLETMHASELHALYASLIDEAQDTVFEPVKSAHPKGPKRTPNFDRARFLFDSVVLVSRDLAVGDWKRTVTDFVGACVLLMEKSFGLALPLRGCIGFGDYLEDAERGIFLSRAFANMVRAEKRQAWSGCYVLPEAEDRVMQSVLLDMASPSAVNGGAFLLRYPVPMTGSAPEEHWCLNWVYCLAKSELEAGMAFLNAEKGANTAAFVQWTNEVEPWTHELSDVYRPAVGIKVAMSACSLRVRFFDAQNESVDPPSGVTLTLSVHACAEGREIRLDVRPPMGGDVST